MGSYRTRRGAREQKDPARQPEPGKGPLFICSSKLIEKSTISKTHHKKL
jgi:hypothetical protein